MKLIQATLKRNTKGIVFIKTALVYVCIYTSASPDAILTTELACLHCAKSHLADFVWEKCHEEIFIAATHHKDEQV